QRNFGKIRREIRGRVGPGTLEVGSAKPSACGQIVKLLRRLIYKHDAVCIRREFKLRVRNLRVNGLTIEENYFSRLVTVKNVRGSALGVSSWRDKLFERAPLFILRHLRHVSRQLLGWRPLTIKAIGRQPLLPDREVVSGTRSIKKQW